MPSRDFFHFTVQQSKCQRRFRDRPRNFAHVFNAPLPSPYKNGLGGSPLEMWDPLRPKYPKNPNIRQKSKIKNISNRLGKGTLNTCAKFQGLSLKNGDDIKLLKEFGVICVNQPVYIANTKNAITHFRMMQDSLCSCSSVTWATYVDFCNELYTKMWQQTQNMDTPTKEQELPTPGTSQEINKSTRRLWRSLIRFPTKDGKKILKQ